MKRKKNDAMVRAQMLLKMPNSQWPPLAYKYCSVLCNEVGCCMEVMLTALVHYAVMEEGINCSDHAYSPTEKDEKRFAYAKTLL